MFVSVDTCQPVKLQSSTSLKQPTCVDNSSEQIIEDVSQTFSIEHPVQSSNKDSLLRVEPLTGAPDVVTVSQHPGDDLHLFAPHPPAGDLEVPGRVAVGALG